MAESLEQQVAALRRFNRFYTRKVGVLEEGLLASAFSLTEARVLYELAQGDRSTARDIGDRLGLDAGYLSRILRGFLQRGLISRERSRTDGRQRLLALSPRGKQAFALLDERSSVAMRGMVEALPARDRARLTEAIARIEGLLSAAAPEAPVRLRTHKPGDFGWIVSRHGAVYAEDYGWNAQIEALAAEVAAKFLRSFDPACERCWIAERGGERVGSVALTKQRRGIAQLRLLFVEPELRGCGLGRQLVAECIRFARQCSYRKLVLWTNDPLLAARRIYESAGFRRIAEKPHREFGPKMTGQNWELALTAR